MMDMPAPLNVSSANASRPRSDPKGPLAGGAARQDLAGASKAPEARPPGQQAPQRQSAQSVSQATRDIADYMQSVSRSLQITVDDDLGIAVIHVRDAQTDELIRQIPPEEALALARFISEQRAAPERGAAIPGILIDQKS